MPFRRRETRGSLLENHGEVLRHFIEGLLTQGRGIANERGFVQGSAVVECLIPDGNDAAGNGHGGQLGAVFERKIPDGSDATGEIHCGQ